MESSLLKTSGQTLQLPGPTLPPPLLPALLIGHIQTLTYHIEYRKYIQIEEKWRMLQSCYIKDTTGGNKDML